MKFLYQSRVILLIFQEVKWNDSSIHMSRVQYFRDEAVGVQIAKIQHFQQVNIGHAKAIFKKFQLHMKLMNCCQLFSLLFAILFYVQHLKNPIASLASTFLMCTFYFHLLHNSQLTLAKSDT